ncbi:uncharacterized protein LOC111633672 [Centruroides sculpturatus]|uniref:uncharacterized protein LOC111633672 n=1 Tax=Centruroides sculpturatus TaxID=218467 RepID=UPI000C6E356B|nr:uncharacterized protein LOC111633672 [Centruroides sculpturatus]
MAHSTSRWTVALPTVLLGFRAVWKDDIQATAAEMLYGASLRIPGEFLSPTQDHPDPATFVGRLREEMHKLKPVTRPHRNAAVFVHKDLSSCAHVFLRTDTVRRGLQPPYEGPYRVLKRGPKNFKLEVKKRHITVNIDRLKPAYICADDSTFSPSTSTTASAETATTGATTTVPPAEASPQQQKTVTRAGRCVKFNPRYL